MVVPERNSVERDLGVFLEGKHTSESHTAPNMLHTGMSMSITSHQASLKKDFKLLVE